MIRKEPTSNNGEAQTSTTADAGESARRLSTSKSYIGYLFRSMNASNIYRRIRKALLWLSRIRILSTVMKILTFAAAVIEAGTHIVIVSTLTLILIPIAALIAVTTLIISAVGQKRANEYLKNAANSEEIYVLFPESADSAFGSGFLHGLADELSTSKSATVFIVSPSFWRGSGFGGRKYYLHYRQDAENVFMLRKYYYFSFRKSVLKAKKESSITLIY